MQRHNYVQYLCMRNVLVVIINLLECGYKVNYVVPEWENERGVKAILHSLHSNKPLPYSYNIIATEG